MRAKALVGILVFLVFAGAAQAQDVDWLLSLDDTGFDPSPAGVTVTYDVSVTNNGFGPTDAPATTIDISIPASTSISGFSGTITGCAPVPVTGAATITCNVPALAANGGTASLALDVDTTQQGTITVSASMPTAGDTDPLNNADSENTSITQGADLDITILGPATAAGGSVVTYDLQVSNTGPDAASNVVVSFPIPTGLINVVPPAGCSLAGSTYTCTIAGPIAPGGSATISFDGQISAASGSTVTALASVTGASIPDPNPANDTDNLNTTISGGSDVSISKSRAGGSPLLVGDPAVFTLSAAYTGDDPNTLTITDTIPVNYTIDSVAPAGGWLCTVVGQTVTCTLTSGSGPGANVSLGSVQINTTVASSGSATNTANISAVGPSDPNPANNSDTDGGATILDPTVDLSANKSGPNPALVVVGNPYNFTISASNVGTAPFFGTLVMTDNVPAGLDVTGYGLSAGWSCLPAAPVSGAVAVTCSRTYTAGAPLAAGATSSAVTLQTVATATGTISNSMTVSSPDANIPDLNPGNDTITYSVTSSGGGNSADISVNKTAVVDPVIIGQTQTFLIEVVNAGPLTSANVVLTDNITNLVNNNTGVGNGVVSVAAPPGFACSTASSGGTSRRLTCNIASLAVCTPGVNCPVVSVDVTVGGNGALRTNRARAISNSTADPNLSNNADTDTYTTEARADVQMTKVGSPSPATAGQNLTYVLTALNVNNGLSAADNVTITDTLPANVTFISASPSSGSCATTPTANTTTGAASNNIVTCNLGTINNGAQQTVTVVVRPNSITRSTSIVNNAIISTSTTETDGSNNTASATIPVQNPVVDLLVNKSDDVDPLAIGDNVTYTIVVNNLGPSSAENIVVADLMPATGLTFQSVSTTTGGSCPAAPPPGTLGASITCNFPFLAAGQTATVTLVATGVAKGTVANNVTVSSDETTAGFDSDPLNNNQSENTTVRTRADVRVTSKVATPATINLRDNFDFVITVDNPTGPGLSEADNVVVTDILPANTVLTSSPTVAVTSGSATASTCTGGVGGTSFTCDLGTFSSGAVAQITVPVEVIATSSQPQVLTNSATISTSSLDVNPGNDTNSGTVTVASSSIAGNVFRDFNANDVLDGGTDTGIGGITMTLTGTDFDGNSVTRTVLSLADGSYNFDFLPSGTYTVTRGTVAENYLTDGSSTAGSAGGTGGAATVISGIALPANTPATGYLFPLVPQARIGIAKTVLSGPTSAADGSFVVTFRMNVQNPSLEALNNVVVTDPLLGNAPGFGAFAALGTPATDPMARGTFTLLSGPSGSCGGLQASYDGSGSQSLATGFTVAAGTSCVIDVAVRVQPQVPLPPVRPSGGRYENQATVTGEGALSGQTSATNPQLTDQSDNGATADSNGNGIANEAGENDPTPVNPAFAPAIALIKTADTAALSAPPVAGETITYNFTVINTGDQTLTNITLNDPLLGIVLTGGAIASLAPGGIDNSTFSATYVLTQNDVNMGMVTNQATATGIDPLDTPVSDPSGTTNGDNTPLVTPLTLGPSIALIKSADLTAVQNPAVIGDTIAYDFTITNTGNVTLTNVLLTDILPGIVISGGPIASMAPGAVDTTTYTATYQLIQADLDNGQVTNQATATGTPPSGPDVSDQSGTDNSNDTPKVSPIGQGASIDLVKTADDSAFLAASAVPGDTVPYTFAITNTGLQTLTNVFVTDLLPGMVVSGGPIASLAPTVTDNTTITGLYTVTAADVAAGQVINTATVTGTYVDGGGAPQTVTDDSTDTAMLIPILAVPEIFPPFATDGGTTTSMLASDTVQNQPATLANVILTVISADPGVTLDTTTGLITLAPGNPAGSYNVTYQICDAANPTICATATETVQQSALPSIETTKTQVVTDNGDGVTGVGDTVTYAITVQNTGNVALSGVGVADTLTTLGGTTLTLDSGPTYVSSDNGSAQGALQIGETATYTASYVLTILAVTEGGLSNTATGSGVTVIPPGVAGVPTTIQDVSDDGIDSDGNTVDDPTVLAIAPSLAAAGLTLTKTTPLGVVVRGQVVPYTITIRNDNPVVAGSLNLVDVLPPGFLYVPGSSTLNGAPFATTVSGRTITWPGIPVPPLTTVTATLQARVTDGAQSGEHVNTASARNPLTGALLPPVATATVRIAPEAVFDCGDVIGKVFDDKNRDGYQNAPRKADEEQRRATSNVDGRVEPGIPAVRLVGVDGTIITTDQYGRFHVPCAMLPDDRGSNFILKLDTRSLPAGFRMTTENPRVVRLTPGKMTEMNFGAAITKIVRVDLNRNAFVTNGNGRATLSPALTAGISKLLPQIANEAHNIRLAYHLPKGAGADQIRQARKLMRLVERHIRRQWRDVGQVKLTVERTIVRSGQ